MEKGNFPVIESVERVLNIRPGEWLDIFVFWMFNALLWTGLSIGESVAEALFLKRIGVDFLPYMFIICSLVSITVSLIFSRIQNRFGKTQMAVSLGFASIVLVLICSIMIRLEIYWGSPFLYVAQNILSTLLTTHFYILLSGHYRTLDAKRLVPLILSGTVAGCICGGLSLKFLARPGGVDDLLFFWILLLAAYLSWYLIFCKRVFRGNLSPEDQTTGPKYVSGGLFERWVYEARAVLGSPLLMILAFSTFLMTMSRYFIEFQYCDIFSRAYPTEGDLARFFGLFVIISNVVALAFQGFLTTRLVQWLGVSNANLFYPISTFLAFLSVSFSYSVPSGVFARFNQEGLRRCVFTPVNNLLYNAIPAKQRARSLTFNEGIVVPLATITAGLALMVLSGSPSTITLVAVAFSAIWVAVTWWQREAYSRSLLDLLKRSQLENLSQEDQDLGSLDAQTQILVIDSLKDPQDEVAELAADLLIRFGQTSAKLALLREASHARNSIKVKLISKLSRFHSPDVRTFLIKSLQDGDDETKLAALEAMTNYPQDDETRLHISGFLEYPDIRHQASAAAAVVRGGDLAQMMQALLVLQKVLFNPNAPKVALGIKALGQTRDSRFWVNLKPYLSSKNDELRLEAMKSMNLMIKSGDVLDHLDILQKLLRDSVREIRSLAIQIISRSSSPQSISLLIDALGDSSPRNRRLAIQGLSNVGTDIVPDLFLILDDPQSSIFSQEGAVKILSLSQDPQLLERLNRFALGRIRSLYELKIDQQSVALELNKEDGEYLYLVLSEKARAHLKLVLSLLAPEAENGAARRVFKNLYSPNQEMMSNAIEVLQSMGERTLIYHLLPLLEGLPLAQIASYGTRAFNIETRNIRMVLGRYLVSLDTQLKEAAIFTIGRMKMMELAPNIKKIREKENNESSLSEICNWTLDRIAQGGLFSERETLT